MLIRAQPWPPGTSKRPSKLLGTYKLPSPSSVKDKLFKKPIDDTASPTKPYSPTHQASVISEVRADEQMICRPAHTPCSVGEFTLVGYTHIMSKKPPKVIVQNRKARHDFAFEKQFEAGMVLEGWEIKSLREGRGQLNDAFVSIHKGEAWLVGAHISPLSTVSTHIQADPTRRRKLLLHDRELNQLIGAVQRQGYTVVPLDLHWYQNRVKCEIALAKGKKQHDKRDTDKSRSWQKTHAKIMKGSINRPQGKKGE